MRAADISPLLDSCSLWARVDRHSLYPAGMSQDIGLLDVFRRTVPCYEKNLYTHIHKYYHSKCFEIGSTSSISLRIPSSVGIRVYIIHRRIKNWSFKYFCWVAPFPLHFQTCIWIRYKNVSAKHGFNIRVIPLTQCLYDSCTKYLYLILIINFSLKPFIT